MTTTMTTVDREFSPSEAAAITGVSVDLQRDWRRRELLPENEGGKWTRFRLDHVIQMSVMKVFADAGFSVSYVAKFASMAILPTLALLHDTPGAVVFEGDEVSDHLKEMTLQRSVVGARGRYLVMIKPREGAEPKIARFEDLERLDDFMAERDVVACTVLDCILLSQRIVERAGLPLVRIEVEVTDRGSDHPKE